MHPLSLPSRILAAAMAFAAFLPHCRAEVSLHPLFTSHAVLQRERPVPVWGTAAPGEKVTVTLAGKSVSTTAADGKWRVDLPAMPAGGPHVLKVEGSNTIKLEDVLIGEVWLCSGQSNMAFRLERASNAAEAIAASANENLRLFIVPTNTQDEPQSTTACGPWTVSGPATAGSFSAVAYFFGRDLQKALGVPVGLINSSVGGTPVEAWSSKEALASTGPGRKVLAALAAAHAADPRSSEEIYRAAMAAWKIKSAEAKAAGQPKPEMPKRPIQRPTNLYNAMIAPLVPCAIRGAIWYQGEANGARPEDYRQLLPAMIEGWRKDFGQQFPFLLVQLPAFDATRLGVNWAWMRESMAQIARTTPSTAMAVAIDAGTKDDIHPTNKEPVGARLALAARSLAYGEKIQSRGPEFKAARFADGKAVVSFDFVGKGLLSKGEGPMGGFSLAGEDQQFYPATAVIVGETVEVSSPQVPSPKAARYAWDNWMETPLFNADGLPAAPFRSDSWPGSVRLQAQPAPNPGDAPAP